MQKAFHVAIDGPIASGKSTVSRLLAKRLGFLYVDTGAMYRATALLLHRKGLSFEDSKQAVKLLQKNNIILEQPTENDIDSRLITVKINDEDVSWEIRTELISHGASVVSQFLPVRKILVKQQQDIAKGKDVIMEGRDITHNVLPEAQLKIYLTADEMIRVKRRHLQLLMQGEDVGFVEVYSQLAESDQREMTRKYNALKIVPEAWVVDTSDISIEKVVALIAVKVRLLREAERS